MPSSPNPPDRAVGVAVPVPGLGLLTYRVPSDSPLPPKGARVSVPLGPRTVVGCVVDTHAAMGAGGTLKTITAVLDSEPFLPNAVVDLALWVADYYACGPGDVLLMAMPPASRTMAGDAFRRVTIARLAALVPPGVAPVPPSSAMAPADAPAGTAAPPADAEVRGARARQVLARLRDTPQGVSLPVLAREGIPGDAIRRLAARGLVVLEQQIDERDPFAVPDVRRSGAARPTGAPGADAAEPAGLAAAPATALWTVETPSGAGRPLTEEQALALDELRQAADARTFRTMLLHGVTGSGKTEVYLRLARHVLDTGRRVLVLVPEIALTPAVAGAFRAAFGPRVAIQHSGLSPGERHDQWHRIRRGEVDVVVGTRSAVFAPVDALGLVIVDEEHEGAYKQDETPRYHGRDVAVVRGQMAGALVVLGSATPSLESSANVTAGRYGVVRLTRRVHDRPLADVRIVDMRREYAARGAEVALSSALMESIEARLSRGEQSLVLLNRRGFATVVFCRQCAASIECPHCSVMLTYHRAARRLRCHYCDFSTALPRACGACGGEFLEQAGVGTERLEHDLRDAFPGARVARVDRDTMRRRGSLARVLGAVARGDIDILVGTQMIAKGHDFPSVTLVGVVSADVGLGLADFRAGERTFQLLTQVVGRAGRGAAAGEAIVQTLYPTHYSIQTAAAQDYAAFFARELEFRRAMQYPPDVALINVVVKGPTIERAIDDARDLAVRVRQAAGTLVVGPAPAALAKVKDEYRAQFFVKGRQRRAMRMAVQSALDARPDLKRRTIVDVDPGSVS